MNDKSLTVSCNKFNSIIGITLRRYRCENSLKGAELAKLMHISQQQISRYERGITKLTLYQIYLFLKVFNTPMNKFIDDVKMEIRMDKIAIDSSNVDKIIHNFMSQANPE